MSTDDLTALENWVQPLLAKLTTTERNALARKVGQALRKSQAQRIAGQQAPDGSAFAPRKVFAGGKIRGKKGSIRSEAMFSKLRTAKWLKVQVTGEGVAVGFLGRASRIASVHQGGERDLVKPGGPAYQYPVRELLGFTAEDRENIQDLILQHLKT
ncbi:phage virion morphogenesis protein [Polaromonas naphthalenivorans]|uniref:Phage virion morphogenesis protein n=1 Tax=Polaromonas naphthalenivorans (strain CJ2) TaxID=365044 RepID=A1VSG9_POLNA|nr:phage virion morphogenesis protein [Polaromonas naphthalenivorans]ABM38597.1 phage virion morphogenesis protein [Polaromonas naphthalenivorans CJ2]